MTRVSSLADLPIWSFIPDGGMMNIAAPDPDDVCFLEIGNTLSKIARFNGRHAGPPISVAQHCVMGAQAIVNVRGGETEAALFLLHDAHEWIIGDICRPTAHLFAVITQRFYDVTIPPDAITIAKAQWDEAIYAAAGLPGPDAWTRRQRDTVTAMDERMARAEAIALYGPRVAEMFPNLAAPKTTGAIRPWPAAKAEEEFHRLAVRLIGEDRIGGQAAAVALRRAMAPERSQKPKISQKTGASR